MVSNRSSPGFPADLERLLARFHFGDVLFQQLLFDQIGVLVFDDRQAEHARHEAQQVLGASHFDQGDEGIERDAVILRTFGRPLVQHGFTDRATEIFGHALGDLNTGQALVTCVAQGLTDQAGDLAVQATATDDIVALGLVYQF